jgi:metal-responsive CopG/Arc/MetJ family transcriptional regulator
LENKNNRQAVEAIINDISTHTQDIKFVKVMVMMYADTKEQLSEKYKEVQKEFESFGGFSYDMNFRQKECFLSMQPFR